MKKPNELDDEEIKTLKEKFREKHNRSILLQSNNIFGCFKIPNLFEIGKSSSQKK
jgi:hypothetical protein